MQPFRSESLFRELAAAIVKHQRKPTPPFYLETNARRLLGVKPWILHEALA